MTIPFQDQSENHPKRRQPFQNHCQNFCDAHRHFPQYLSFECCHQTKYADRTRNGSVLRRLPGFSRQLPRIFWSCWVEYRRAASGSVSWVSADWALALLAGAVSAGPGCSWFQTRIVVRVAGVVDSCLRQCLAGWMCAEVGAAGFLCHGVGESPCLGMEVVLLMACFGMGVVG